MKTRVIYHADPDGFCSAAIVCLNVLEYKGMNHDVIFTPMNYGYNKPVIGDDEEEIYMLDFSYQPEEEMVEFCEKYGDRLVWIDHHKTSVDVCRKYNIANNISGIRTSNDEYGDPIAGCELTWDYIQGCRFGEKSELAPLCVRLVGEWDTWRWKKNKIYGAKHLNAWMKGNDVDPRNVGAMGEWSKLLNNISYVSERVKDGEKICKHIEYQDSIKMKTRSFEGKFGVFDAIMINETGNSEMFNGFYDKTRHQLMVAFVNIKNQYWTVSLYSERDDVDCATIAKTLGASEYNTAKRGSGGGHKGAAGFQTSWNHLERLIKKE